MYQLTENPDTVLRTADDAVIPRGHRWWDEYEAWQAAGNTPEPAPAPDLVGAIKARMSAWLDSVVQARGYDNIVSCASYAASTNDTFKAEATAAIAWRDAVYAKGYELLAAPPEGISTPDDVLALLPRPEDFGWPAAKESNGA